MHPGNFPEIRVFANAEMRVLSPDAVLREPYERSCTVIGIPPPARVAGADRIHHRGIALSE
jgi:hypothetical protein